MGAFARGLSQVGRRAVVGSSLARPSQPAAAIAAQSGRKRWQRVANRAAPKTAEIRRNRLPWVAMVRRGSTVRVRQRALQSPSKSGVSHRTLYRANKVLLLGFPHEDQAFRMKIFNLNADEWD